MTQFTEKTVLNHKVMKKHQQALNVIQEKVPLKNI